MSMINIHAASKEGIGTVYHEFILRYSRGSKVVYGFVEGKEDLGLYKSFIESQLPDEWTVDLWAAGNKSKVYDLHSIFDWGRFVKNRVCFFVDRDLSSLIPEDLPTDRNIYITEGYSIENEIVSKKLCGRVLVELLGFSACQKEEVDAVERLFDEQCEEFRRKLVPVMAWILGCRRQGYRPNLSGIRMSDLFSFNAGVVSEVVPPKGEASLQSYLHRRCGLQDKPFFDNGPLEAEFMQYGQYQKFVRGKFVLWFLVEFCLSVREQPSAWFSSTLKAPKMNITLSASNGLAVIGPRVRVPRRLSAFVSATYGEYVEAFLAQIV